MRFTYFKTAQRAALSALAAVLITSTLASQDSASSLETQLGTIFKVTHVEMVGHNVTTQGTIVKLTKGNFLLDAPVGTPVPVASFTSTVKEGKDSVPSFPYRALIMKNGGGFLPEGQRLYITKIQVNVSKDAVTLELTDAAVDPTTGGLGHPSLKTAVSFVFAKGFLSNADAGQVADVISATLAADTAPAVAAASPVPEPPPPPESPAPMPMQVELGMTEEQVRGILGQPNQQQGAPQSKVYVYKKQITFQNGKVSDIQ
jgi:hypothetical protein